MIYCAPMLTGAALQSQVSASMNQQRLPAASRLLLPACEARRAVRQRDCHRRAAEIWPFAPPLDRLQGCTGRIPDPRRGRLKAA
jgi:hypothetical protein